MSKSTLINLDRNHLIHPVVNFRDHEKKGVTVLQSGQGSWLNDIDGNRMLDAFSGLWCVNVGYGQQSVVHAAMEQMSKLPYATGYFSFGSEPAIQLAAELVKLTPASLEHVYFSLGGSDAVDAAIRYITHYYNAIGQPQKKQFIALQRGYHGSSSTGAGMTGLPAFHANFDLPRENQHHIPCPYPYRSAVGDDPQAIIDESTANLRAKVNELGADNVAAFFCEPIIGSGGVIVPPKGWLKAMETTCRELGILLLVDEVITGFGRTGPMFACEAEGVEPDFLTLAKGLTAGYAPMGAMLMSDKVYAGIADGPNHAALVGHGQTYSAHPVSAAIALEVLRLYQEGGLLANGAAVTPYFSERLQAMKSHPLVGDARSRGLLGAIELVTDKTSKSQFDSKLNVQDRLSKIAYNNNIIFRVFGDAILGFAPALCFSESEFEFLFDKLTLSLDQLLQEPDIIKAVS
jgi:adenosylmethionine-8-amino-7-oxononanoate aminotransferase